jgi:hypothetical protein
VDSTQLQRLLELVRRQLDADDARVEFGGRAPTDPRVVWAELPNGWRLVAVLAEPPAEPGVAEERLAALVDAFGATTEQLAHDGGSRPPPGLVARQLDDELGALAAVTGAVAAVVVDAKSPVLWGSSLPRDQIEEIDSLLGLARHLQLAVEALADPRGLLDPGSLRSPTLLKERGVSVETAHRLARWCERIAPESGPSDEARCRREGLLALALAAVRAQASAADEGGAQRIHAALGEGLFRRFASVYRLVLVFEGSFSELHAEGAMIRRLPCIEQLVLALPPVDPPPRFGRLIRLPIG